MLIGILDLWGIRHGRFIPRDAAEHGSTRHNGEFCRRRRGRCAVLIPVAEPIAHATTTYAVSAAIGVDDEADGGSIAVDPGSKKAYVTSYDQNRVAVINTATNQVVKRIDVGRAPTGVAIDNVPTQLVKSAAVVAPAIIPPVLAGTPTVFVGNYGDQSISVISIATNTVVATVPIPGNLPADLAVDPSTHTLFAGGGSTSGVNDAAMTVVDEEHRTVKSTVTTSGFFRDIAVDSSTHKVYATGCCLNKFWWLDGPSASSIGTGSAPGTSGIAVNPSTHKVYIGNGNDVGAVSVFDGSTGSVLTTVPVGRDPTGIAVDTSANVIYVSNLEDNSVSVIDGATDKVVATAPVGVSPGAVDVDQATHTAYVIDQHDDAVSVISRTVTGSAARLAGADRFETAVAVSKAEFPGGGAGAVVLARGDDYPDALVGAPLAAAKNAPLLLTSGSSLPAVIKAEIQRVLAAGGTIYVLGGDKAVPASVESELTGMGYQVVRYSGANRFQTAVKVADALGDPATVLLATGVNFPDALSAGVAAAKVGGVVLLTNGPSLPAETSAYLAAHPGSVFAIGGPAAKADPSATAVFGSDRFETAVDVAMKFFSGPTAVGVATGLSFPDALSGGALLGHVGAPLVLVSATSMPGSVTSYLASVKTP
jgi:YVTN family beta-propeller protein